MKCLLLACLLAVSAPMSFGNVLIVGGQESTPHSRPYQAALFDSAVPDQAYFYCGGTLVHEEWVVSAAHCSANNVHVGLGYHDKTVHGDPSIEYIHGTWTTHPQYDAQSLDNDIAMIKLDKPVTLSANIKTIGISSTEPMAGEKVLVSGWGALNAGDFTLPDKLMEVKVDVIDYSTCNTHYGGRLSQNMICAGIDGGGRDACQGDNGGPLVSGYGDIGTTMLRGIVSWGWGCAHPAYPGVYTNIANYCSWIASTTGNAVTCK